MDVSTKCAEMKQFFMTHVTHDYAFRYKQLQCLKQALKTFEARLLHALKVDLNKPEIESYSSEIGVIYEEISYACKNLKAWMRPNKVSTPLSLVYSQSHIQAVPLGLVLIIAPWNYPVQLLLAPLVGAIAAGNCAVVKPSEYTPSVASVLAEMLQSVFSEEYILLVNGDGIKVVPELINTNQFNHVFFTGSTKVGRSIASLCADKLIPYTLELGGKSPCIVDESVNLRVACKRIAWGKFFNAGQTCIAPDYVLVDAKIKNLFISELKLVLDKFYKHNTSVNMSKIVNKNRMVTLSNYLMGSNVIYGGEVNADALTISPTLIEITDINHSLMKEEIFGSILPIIEYNTETKLYELLALNPNPLALYVFSKRDKFCNDLLRKVQFGGGGINTTLFHFANIKLPFGGVMQSGTGSYHGKYSFDTFSHRKSIVKTGTFFDAFIKYPPYNGFELWVVKRLFGVR